jgi:hypothetical protein
MAHNFKNNTTVSPEAITALNQMKAEVSRELDIAKPEVQDRANLTSRQNGYVGGYLDKEKKRFNLKDHGTNII